jgi:thiol-disulfide isomerase/thioredoxin
MKHSSHLFSFLAALLLVVWALGCGSQKVAEPAEDEDASEVTVELGTEATPEVFIRPWETDAAPAPESGTAESDNENGVPRTVDRAAYDSVIQSSTGKVVLVDCWGTWCVPCRDLLPHTAELGRRNSELAIVTLAFDEPDSMGEVAAVLNEKGVPGTHLVAEGGLEEAAFATFDIASAALPHYKIYGRDGKLIRTLGENGEKVSAGLIDQAVAEALAE